MIFLGLLIGALFGGLMADGLGGALLGAGFGVALVLAVKNRNGKSERDTALELLQARVEALEAWQRQEKHAAAQRRELDAVKAQRRPSNAELTPIQPAAEAAMPSPAPSLPPDEVATTPMPLAPPLARNQPAASAGAADDPLGADHRAAASSAAAAMPQAAAPTAAAPVARPVAPVLSKAATKGPPPSPPIEMPEWVRWVIGANTIVKVGLAMLFLGLAFLARYAADRITVSIELRLVGIGVVGLVLLAIGWRVRNQRRGYGLLMQGGGVAVMYLTLFASAKVFGVLGIGPVFMLMIAVALLAAALAVLQNAQAMAIVGTVGGYATPLLLSTGGGRVDVLLGYYLVLGLGVASIAWAKLWPRLNLLAFGFTAVVSLAWGLSRYTPAHHAMAQGYLIAYWLLFTAILLLPGRKATEPDKWVNATLLFGVPVLGSGIQYALLEPNHSAIAVAALIIGAAYIGLGAWARQRRQHGAVFEAFLAMGAVFGTLVIPFALSAEATAGAWALEGLGALWLGLRQRRKLVWLSGLALMLLGGAGLHGALNGWWGSGYWPSALLNAVLLSAAGLAGARVLHRAGQGGESDQGLAAILVGWGTVWLGVIVSLLVQHTVPDAHTFEATLALIATGAALLLVLQRWWQWPLVAWPTGLLLPTWVLMGLDGSFIHGAPLLHGLWWALPLAWLVQGAVLQWTAPHWPEALRRVTHTGCLLGLALLGALQGRYETAGWGDDWSAWGWLGWLLAPTLLLALVLHQQRRAPEAQVWPLRLAPEAYSQWGGAALTAALAFWALIANWMSNGSAQPLPHLPLLNPLDIGIAAALLAVFGWLRSAAAHALLGPQPKLMAWVLGGLGFLWLNGILIRAFHHWGGVPYRVSDWMASWGVQTGLALLWTVMALVLMLGSARRLQRAPWVVGACLLGAVVAKLLLFDLQGSGTVMRIVSFIGVGVLMLVIGYVAPLPGSASDDKQKAA